MRDIRRAPVGTPEAHESPVVKRAIDVSERAVTLVDEMYARAERQRRQESLDTLLGRAEPRQPDLPA